VEIFQFRLFSAVVKRRVVWKIITAISKKISAPTFGLCYDTRVQDFVSQKMLNPLSLYYENLDSCLFQFTWYVKEAARNED
jgi:hypothetical protein